MAPRRPNTTRAAKTKAQARMKKLGGHREEVTFPNVRKQISDYESDEQPELETVDFTVGDATESDGRNHNSRRVDILESEVAQVRAEVAGINSKLDLLVNAALDRDRPVSHSTPPATTRRPGQQRFTQIEHSEPPQPLPPPHRLREQANHDGYVDAMLDRQTYAPPRNEGKPSYYDNGNDMPKPYMYIDREACQTTKQKLDVRCTLAPLEYISAIIALLRDKRAYSPHDHGHIMSHLQDLTHDAAERPWPAVRKWSQQVWNQIERGDIRWSDYQLIQNLRVRMAITAGPASQEHGAAKQGLVEVVCRDHGKRSGCRHNGTHTEGNLCHLHVCAFCDCLSRTCQHGVFFCERKLQQRPNPDRQPQFHQPQAPHTQQWRHPVNIPPPGNYAFTQPPKNGQLAPRLY